MAEHQGHSLQDLQKHDEGMKWYDEHMKHWRAWGSWFSWGSPVGLGLFFLACAGTVWILGQTFNW